MSNGRVSTTNHQGTIMNRMLRPLLVAGFALAGASPLAGQGIEGTWITEFERSVRNENGAVSGGEKTRAKMVLQQKGDSVSGTWEVVGPGATTPATPRQLRGTRSGNKLTLSSEFDATVNINGEQSTRKIGVIYELTVTADKLEGTMRMTSGDMDMPPRPFSAWREKS